MLERGGDVAARDKGEALDAVEVGVLDGHDARVAEELLGPVVDELAVDKAVDAVGFDAVDFLLHLFALRALELGELARRLGFDARAEDFDLVRVHGGVGDEDFGVFEPLGLVGADALVEDEAWVEVRVRQLAARFLDDLDVREVGGAAEAEDGGRGEVGEVGAVLGEDFRGEGGAGDGGEGVAECLGVGRLVGRGGLEGFERRVGGEAVALDDGLGVDFAVDELFGFPQEFGGEDGDGGGAVANHVVLDFGDVDEDLSGGVVEGNRFEDRGTVVCHHGFSR